MHIVSTDGSCLKNPGGAIGWAWVDHSGRRCDPGGAASGTNQSAELQAILEALKAHPGAEPLMIESDSQYAIRCATEWLPGWKRKGWRTASGGPVQNLALIQTIDAEITQRPGPVRFRWVRGHVGNVFNERADELAGAAARDWAAGRGVSGNLFPPEFEADTDEVPLAVVAGGAPASDVGAGGAGGNTTPAPDVSAGGAVASARVLCNTAPAPDGSASVVSRTANRSHISIENTTPQPPQALASETVASRKSKPKTAATKTTAPKEVATASATKTTKPAATKAPAAKPTPKYEITPLF
ncbi:MAG: ribonuclease HI [Cellulomonadaceae bacterium]|nr:ribonuclease HI [Cellulomonadaceae bacterium]